MYLRTLLASIGLLAAASAAPSSAGNKTCPGYAASNVKKTTTGLTADLNLNGKACNLYGTDLDDLVLEVEYQTSSRLHVKIYDKAEQVYQIPTSVVEPPTGNAGGSVSNSELTFSMTQKPFSFKVERTGSGEVLFDSSAAPLIFESQYVRLRTSLPEDPNIYGLGEDTDNYRRNTTNYTRTLWSHDNYLTPPGQNLYGNHPIYFEHRPSLGQTHGVFLFNSNGMDIKINNTAATGQYLEYNTLGGVIDLYFLAGPGPVQVAQQYSDVVGKAAMMPYWGFGFHQCKYGYIDYIVLAEVILNYTLADIPLETMWTDIDYMDGRKVFTLDPLNFPLEKMQELVTYLHDHDQHYIMMVDPAVAYQDYPAFNNGQKDGIFLKNADGSINQGVVWPGVTAFPDWLDPETQNYWNNEFDTFFNAETGVDIDALWIDMNEASNFCVYPCSDPQGYATANGFPPPAGAFPSTWEPLPGFPPDFQPPAQKRAATASKQGLPGRNLINPPYKIQNAAGNISENTIATDIVHNDGYAEYDVHNLYGTTMSSVSRGALLSRRPTVRPLVITRSTFAGAGAKVGHWLGDNTATWELYIRSFSGVLGFAGLYQVPMVGADVCGYALDTTSTLCARWAMLGALGYPFYRNHEATGVVSHEFYRWPIVASAARKAIKARYQLLDYMYTAMYNQAESGTPMINSMWFLYPNDANAVNIDAQLFNGPSLLVSPVTVENSTSVDIYLPNDVFYDFWTYETVRGHGTTVTLDDIAFDDIPLHIRGGSVLPLRIDGANTTTALRKLDFELIVAPGLDGTAAGQLYLDDGDSLVQPATSLLNFKWANGKLTTTGTFNYPTTNKIRTVTVLNYPGSSGLVRADVDGQKSTTSKGGNGALVVTVDKELSGSWTLTVQ